MINKEWFWNNSEGYLGDDEQSSILFILKEPDSGGEDVQKNKFWFKEVVNDNKGEHRYLKILGKEACLLLKMTDKVEALRKCAYINLYPLKGNDSASKDYRKSLILFSEGNDEYHRWDIINNLPAGSCIVTTHDIAHEIKKFMNKDKGSMVKSCTAVFYLRNRSKRFESFSFKGVYGETMIYSTPHPNPRNKKRDIFYEDDILLVD